MMSRIRSLLVGAALAALFSQPVLAGSGTVTGKDAAGTTHTWDVITDGSGNFVWMQGICDGVAAAQCAAVKAASTAPAATDPSMVVTLSQNAGLGAAATPVRIDPTGSTTQPVSGTVTAAQGTAANLNATVVGTGTFAVQAAQSGTWNVTNVSGTVSLPTGASTAAKQPALGTAGAASSDVITIQGIASMTPLLATATQSGTWNITNISGTVSLPTGAATSALQTTGNTTLTTINTTLGTPMQQTGGSVTANAGTNLNTSALATSANQTNASQKTQIVDGSGNVIASTSNNLNVQCANCSGSGVSAADAATFTAGTSLMAPIGAQFTSGGATACVTAHECTLGMTAARGLFTDASSIAGTTTLTGNGTTGAGSQRVTIASDNTAFTVNAAPSAIATWGLVVSTQNSSTPTNGQLAVGQFNTTPTTITSGNVSPLQMDNAGNLLVNIKAGASSGAVAQGSTTSGQTGGLTQAAVTTSAPTYTTATTNPLSMDTSGNLRVVGTGLAQGSTTSGETGSMVMAAVTTSSPSYTNAQTSPLSLDTSGNLRVNVVAGGGSGGTSIADAGTFTAGTTVFTPTGGQFTTGGATACVSGHACWVGMTAARGFFTDISTVNAVTVLTGTGAVGTGAQRIAVGTDTATIAGSAPGTAGTASTNVVSVQGIASMTPLLATATQSGTWNITNISGTVSLPTGASTAALQPTKAAQGSTTSGQTGPLMQGAVTTAAPTYTTAQTSPLSLDTAGNLRVNVVTGGGTGGTSIADAGTFAAGTTVFTPVGGQFTSGGATACVTGHACWAGMTAARGLFTDASSVAGAATLTGNGTTGTGSQRVTIASDNTAFSVNATVSQATSSNLKGQVDPLTATSWGIQAQGATSSGQVGHLVQANVNVGSPTYTDGQVAPLSVDTAGMLRISGNVFQGTAASLKAQVDPLTPANWGIAAIAAAPPANAFYQGTLGSGATGGQTRGVITCDQHAFVDNATQLQTIVAGVASRKTYVCGYIMSTAATATNISLTSGTGTNCVTTSVAITPAYNLLANDRVGFSSPSWNGLITLTAADNLCVSKSAANSGQIEVWFAIL